MIHTSSLEPLADYLRPEFGNIYEYNFAADGKGYEVQLWTPKLQAAVRYYLLHEVTNDEYASFLEELVHVVPAGSREEQAEFIVTTSEPWEVAYAFHLAAVNAVSTLDQLIGHFDAWPDASLQEDVGVWLNTHASEEQLHEMVDLAGHPERDPHTPWYQSEPTGWHLAEGLTPPNLLDAWLDVVGPAESDLTDAEWELLLPFFRIRKLSSGERPRSDEELRALRRAFDGIRYKFARGMVWSRVPGRYGAGRNIYQRYVNYRDAGIFAQMRDALQDNPNVTRVVEWLAEMETAGSRSS